jgi:PAS domain S-box-containing protein
MDDQGKYHVLLIDDNEDHIHLCRRSLDKEGITADWACNRQSAIEKLSCGSHYDAILVDYNLPDATGIEVLSDIRSLGVDAPTIMVTGGGSESIAVEAMKAGAFDYLVKKPGYYDKLPSFIEASVTKYRIERLKAEYGKEIARLAYVIENINESVVIADQSGKITYVNRALNEIYGYDRDELLGQDISFLVKSALLQKIRSEIFDDSPKGWKGELLLAAKSTAVMPALVSTMAIRTESQEIISYVLVAMDITERKKVEESLRKLSMAVEQSPVSIVVTDVDGRIEYVNPLFTNLTGYSMSEAVGLNPKVLKSGRTPHHVYKELWDTILSGGDWRGELLNKKKNGELYWEMASISPVKDEAGRITHFVAVKEDITARKQAEEERKRLVQALAHRVDELTMLNSAIDVLQNDRPVPDLLRQVVTIFGSSLKRSGGSAARIAYGIEEYVTEGFSVTPATISANFETYDAAKGMIQITYDQKTVVPGSEESKLIDSLAKMLESSLNRRLSAEARSRLAAIVDTSEVAIIGKTMGGVITSWNHGAEKLYGYQAAEVIGKSINILVPGDRKNEMLMILGKIGDGDHIRHYETVRLTKDGRILDISLTVSPIIDESGKVIGASSIARDISARKKAEDALRAKNRELEIINSITSALNSTIDINGKLQKVLADTLELVGADSGGIYLQSEDRADELYLSTALVRSEDGRRVRYRQILPNRAGGEIIRHSSYGLIVATELFGEEGFGGIVPLFVGENTIGLIVLYSKAGYNHNAMERELTAIGSQAGIAVQNYRLFKKVQDASRYLTDIVNESPDPIVTINAIGVIDSFNKSASTLLKYPVEDVIGKSLSYLLPAGRQIDLNNRKSYVHEFLRKDGTVVTLNVSTSRLPREGDVPGYVITLKDLSSITGFKVVPITETASETDQIYHFEKGYIYLFDRGETDKHLEVFADLVKHNIQGLCITRHNPNKIREKFGLEKTPFVWLTGTDMSTNEQCIKPENLTALNATINKFLAEAKDGVVLLDGAEYLIARNSYESFLKLVHILNDHVMQSNSILQLCIDPAAIDKQQFHQLITEVREFSERGGHTPAED